MKIIKQMKLHTMRYNSINIIRYLRYFLLIIFDYKKSLSAFNGIRSKISFVGT